MVGNGFFPLESLPVKILWIFHFTLGVSKLQEDGVSVALLSFILFNTQWVHIIHGLLFLFSSMFIPLFGVSFLLSLLFPFSATRLITELLDLAFISPNFSYMCSCFVI